jgi:hypothetical protein
MDKDAPVNASLREKAFSWSLPCWKAVSMKFFRFIAERPMPSPTTLCESHHQWKLMTYMMTSIPINIVVNSLAGNYTRGEEVLVSNRDTSHSH